MHVPVTTTFSIEATRSSRTRALFGGSSSGRRPLRKGFVGGLKSIIGGHIGAYTEMCEQARQQAYDLLIQHAMQMGANAVVGLRYDASEVGGKKSATEVLCYGTAVVIEPVEKVG